MKWVYVLERSVSNVDRPADRPIVNRLGIFATIERAHAELKEWASCSAPKGHEKLMWDFRILAEPLDTKED